MNNCCDNSYQEGGTITQPQIISGTLINSMLVNAQLTGGITLDDGVKISLVNQLCPLLNNCILQIIDGSELSDLKINNTIVDSAVVRGTVTLDATAKASLASELCQSLTTCIIDTVTSNTLTGVILEAPNITGTPVLSADAVNAIADSLTDKLVELVMAALTDNTLCCLNINGAEISNSTGENNNFNTTTLSGDTNINGNINLSTSAASDLCFQMMPCIDDRVTEILNTNGTVITDNDTILGNGAIDHPLHVNLDTDIDSRLLPVETTDTDLPTTIIGGRDKLMGRPDGFVRIGAYLLPYFNA